MTWQLTCQPLSLTILNIQDRCMPTVAEIKAILGPKAWFPLSRANLATSISEFPTSEIKVQHPIWHSSPRRPTSHLLVSWHYTSSRINDSFSQEQTLVDTLRHILSVGLLYYLQSLKHHHCPRSQCVYFKDMESHKTQHATKECISQWRTRGGVHDHGIPWLYHVLHQPEATGLIEHWSVLVEGITETPEWKQFSQGWGAIIQDAV